MNKKISSSKINYVGAATISGNYSIYQIINVNGPESLLNSSFILSIRQEIRAYMGQNNLDIINNGLRFIINIGLDGKISFALAHKEVPAQSVHDWLAPNNMEWKPAVQKSGFYKFVEDASTKGLDHIEYGNKLVYMDNDKNQNDLIAVEDGRSTAKAHFIILANGTETTKNGSYMDEAFSDEMWVNLFKFAHQIVIQHSDAGNEIMLTSNMGMFLQSGTVAHMHVQVDTELPSWDPLDYGNIETLESYRIALPEEHVDEYINIIKKYLPQIIDGKKVSQSQAGLEAELTSFFKRISE